MSAVDERWMGRALELARRGVGETNPNPMVGCVIVRGGRVVGEGWHRGAGGPHAEVEALRKAGKAARGATLYVSLEPCAHHGRTPPCVDALLEARPRRVVAAMRDPNPAVDGRGLSRLRRSGMATTVGVRQDEARLLNERFVVAARLPRPFVLLKAALTLDGRVATAAGESKWITSPAQRRRARALRRLHDGVAVGVGTVLADDPLLLPTPATRRAFHRVIFDSRLRLPPGSRLATSVSRSPVWVVTVPGADPRARAALEARGVRIVETDGVDERVDLAPALATLRQAGLWSLMVEGGSELLGAFLRARVFDQVALFRAPLLLGGRGARPAFGGPDAARLADAVRLTRRSPLVARGSSARSPAAPDDDAYELWYPAR